MDELRATALEKELDELLQEKSHVIAQEIVKGCEKTDSLETIYVKMARNAIGISIKISVGIAVDMLIECGAAVPKDEEQIRKNILSVVK